MNEDPGWLYVDSPWDLLRDCYKLQLSDFTTDWSQCIMSHMLGVLSAYIFPLVGLFGLASNLVIAGVVFWRLKRPNRQMIYLGAIACSDWITLFTFGWFWVFPAKGLPYASGGTLYYFTFNESRAGCKIHRFVYSFSSCLSSSLLLATAIDRCLSIYHPLQFSRLPRTVAWKTVGVTTVLSFLMMLPFAIVVDHYSSQGKIICWLPSDQIFLQLYHVLFANASFLQTIAIILVNIALLVKLQRTARERQQLTTSASGRKEIAASVTLLILSAIVVICALPQTLAYMFAFIFQQTLHGRDSQQPIRFAYNIADLSWHLLFIQSSTNFILYFIRMKNFREATVAWLCCGRFASAKQRSGEETGASTVRYTTNHQNHNTGGTHDQRKSGAPVGLTELDDDGDSEEEVDSRETRAAHTLTNTQRQGFKVNDAQMKTRF